MVLRRLFRNFEAWRLTFWRNLSRRPVQARKFRRRIQHFEMLEQRQMLAAAVWTNVLQPLNVSDQYDGFVTPLDALLVVNELNQRKFSNPQTSALFPELPAGQRGFFFDVTCDSFVTPLDALLVINALNRRDFGGT